MVKTVVTVLMMAAGLALGTDARAQTPAKEAPKTEKPAPAAAKPPEPQGQPVNIQIELTITDQAGGVESGKKTVSMIVADRRSGSIRTSGIIRTADGSRPVSINVDVLPFIAREGLVRVDLGLDYTPRMPETRETPPQAGVEGRPGAGVTERISTFLESGKSRIISQAADPSIDRHVTVEIKATILK
jgi:hypothetical protein